VFGEGWSMGPLDDELREVVRQRQGDIQYRVEWGTLAEYLDWLVERGVSPNVASFVGATTVRAHVLGFEDRPPSEAELAETLGDTLRTKMPHGAKWNRANVAGQVILLIAFVMLGIRIAGWLLPGSWADQVFFHALDRYKWIVDVFLAGIVGYGFYFWFSGRVWCRFLCPLAALMHVYARFSRFRISADKKKCISCNVCTSVCHQGIDVMNFANKGLPMQDPQCVRCSACVQSCPTGVLSFTRLARDGREVPDRLAASPVRMREG
jgi:ferredoxin